MVKSAKKGPGRKKKERRQLLSVHDNGMDRCTCIMLELLVITFSVCPEEQ